MLVNCDYIYKEREREGGREGGREGLGREGGRCSLHATCRSIKIHVN